jgi:hypothetical protein
MMMIKKLKGHGLPVRSSRTRLFFFLNYFIYLYILNRTSKIVIATLV